MTRLRALALLGAVLLAAGTAAFVVLDDSGVWPHGPRVTAAGLRQQLERSGLEFEWRRGRVGGGVEGVVAGVASRDGRDSVGFELDVASGDHADGDMLGRAGFPLDYDIPNDPCERPRCVVRLPKWRPDPRGVVGNVAYANYHLDRKARQGDQPTIERLDDALFAAFRPDDERAFPVLPKPPPDPSGWPVR
ncbi:MAG TPA: hypothetical protein VJT75_02855 [Thermoleophilaceae bacterium]|nr:hypothetical protein [Thermoleophilaceae bacterium]